MTAGQGALPARDTSRAGCIPRALEALAALAGLVMASPVLVAAAIAVRLSSPGPVLFRQERVGRGGRRFTLLKLRSMHVDGDGPQVTAGGDARVTAVGRLLRKLKIDELPALWNVVCGDMSLVGPRPEVPSYVDLAEPLWERVLRARPGITDPVTLRLRNEEALLAAVDGDRERFYLDTLQRYKLLGYAHYLDHRTCLRDLGVLLWSALVVVLPGLTPAPTLDEIRRAAQRGSWLPT